MGKSASVFVRNPGVVYKVCAGEAPPRGTPNYFGCTSTQNKQLNIPLKFGLLWPFVALAETITQTVLVRYEQYTLY